MLAIGKNLTTEQRLSKAVVDIMANPKYIALAGVLMIGNRSIDNNKAPTACTNGRDEWYNSEFVDGLSDPQLRFLVLHEVYHKLYKHLITWQHLYKENPKKANIACDYVINIKIADDNKDGWAIMPDGGFINEKYRGWDSAAVYADLDDNCGGGDEGGDGNGGHGGFDEHDWDGAQELTDSEKRDLARDLDEAIRQGALVAGKTGSGGDRELAELLQPQVNWREVLREFVTTTCQGSDYSTWARPNRRYVATGYYMPSGISEKVDELVIAGDMSGSIGQHEISVILTEAKSICDTVKPDKVRILYWDTKVCADEVYEQHELDDMVNSTKPAGGGGTTVSCVPEYMTDKNITPQAVIVITDGYLGSDWGSWSCPVLWVIIDNDSTTAPSGVTLHVKTADL